MRAHLLLLTILILAASAAPALAPQAPAPADGRKLFEQHCAGCHGGDGRGGERGPEILSSRLSRAAPVSELSAFLERGRPEAGMPGLELPPGERDAVSRFVRRLAAPAAESPVPGEAAAGAHFFFGPGGCAGCHMVRGRGGVRGPDLSHIGSERTLAELEEALDAPSRAIRDGFRVVSLLLVDGRRLRGFLRNESDHDLQLQDLEGTLHSIARREAEMFEREPGSLMPALTASAEERRDLLAFLTRPAEAAAGAAAPPLPGSVSFAEIVNPAAGEWPTYHGRLSGNRHSALDQITPANISRLAPRWSYSISGSERLEVTPVVARGVMYVTTGNSAFALDARTGREIWRYRRPLTRGVVGDAAGAINRGVAVAGDLVYLVTDNAHLIALHRVTGALVWDVEMADHRENYGATAAPLVVGDLVVSGISGGDEGVRGFLDAYRAASGERVWRFWTVPARGEPLAETWKGRALEHGCAATWLTGTYDPGNDLLYWTTGNPCPDYDGSERRGDNLYSDSVLALEPKTGKLRWHHQYTPHDLWDWDAEQTPMLVDTIWGGRPRQLLLQANRNGFFYVLDRVTGELLLARPFVTKLTWATSIGSDGRPQLVPGQVPTAAGTRICPAVEGATNWMSTAFNPRTRLFYVMALEKCTLFRRSPEEWRAGRSFYGGSTRRVPGEPGQKVLRALDIETGRIVWEHPQIGPANSWGGVLSTASGLVFFGDDSGAFAAVDASSGKLLWRFQTNAVWKASPMTYAVSGRQYLAVASGGTILAFGLPDRP